MKRSRVKNVRLSAIFLGVTTEIIFYLCISTISFLLNKYAMQTLSPEEYGIMYRLQPYTGRAMP